ncbi:restriction endonuclease subunit S [Stutzerimonas nitrititolerans]|uniref:restriction endonuclease subunit S n=1 Tax=Stutzerimonas nitrititolerans TaxID=2482751 RepID=UPI003F80EF3F
MTALLTDNLPLLAGAPNGIKKLRELILELAVRGKLVPQDPNDEPASELLKRIAEEKARLVAEGKIKKQKRLAGIEEEKRPFELPVGWEWSRLGELAVIRGGCTPSMSKSEFWGGDIPWVSPKDMHAGDVAGSELKVTPLALEKSSLELVPVGSILLVGRSGILRRKLPAQLTAVPCTINQDLKAISPFQPLLPKYVQLMLLGTERLILLEDVKQGTTVQSIVYDKLFSRLFGLPPLPEQHRIVAKVDELMALCDRLEARQADAESAHAQLVQALLDSLAQARDARDFAQSWQRLAEHFHTLFTTESSIDALKQTLLQLAVMGKLVPQDPNDESASEMLKRIAEEKALLVAEGKIKKQKSLPPIKESEKPADLPGGWEWVRFGCLLDFQGGGQPPKSHFSDELKPGYVQLIQIRDLGERPQPVFIKRELASKFCTPSDIMVGRYGASVGKVFWGKEGAYNVALVKMIDEHRVFSKEFLFQLLKSPIGQGYFSGISRSAQDGFNKSDIEQKLVPLCSITEQHRIVAKVDQLMALCDQLKARLNQARQVHEQLANALVEQAVA